MNSEPQHLQRRKARTRAALITAAQTFIAEGRFDVSVHDLTQAATVGTGSFYNHFESKADLFAAASDDALESLGTYFDAVSETLDDAAEAFCQSFRRAGRLIRLQPDLSRVLLNSGASLMTADRGLAPRARRDLENAHHQGRLSIDNLDVALAVVAGSLIALGHLLLDDAERDDATTTDSVIKTLLIGLNMPANQAAELVARPLPM